MGFLDKAKQAAEQAATRANETVADVQSKRELSRAYQDLGQTAFKLADSGAISHPDLQPYLARIRELEAKHNDPGDGPAADPTEAVEQPLSGAGPGAG
jgi:hypothetical protein